jgi:oxygen-independent coproporphyrinogen-3 oxidase
MALQSSGNPGLYLHIPFCIKKCGYCDFYSQTDLNILERFLKSLLKEIKIYGEEYPVNLTFDTIYFGGGTPSILPPAMIVQILSQIYRYFNISPEAELTLEINPGTAVESNLAEFYKSGINRLSIGVQSFNDQDLQFLDRIHSAREAIRTIEITRSIGFDNISLDLIYGLADHSSSRWIKNLETAVKFTPEHLSVYNLTIEKDTPFYHKKLNGMKMNAEDEINRQLFLKTYEFLSHHGYFAYEISNYARSEEYISNHNTKYWKHIPYLGIGPSAHSFWDKKRWSNISSIHDYIYKLEMDIKPLSNCENIDIDTEEFESIFLGLRTYRGISLFDFFSKFNHDFEKTYAKEIHFLINKGFAELANGFFSLNPEGMLLSDEIISSFGH